MKGASLRKFYRTVDIARAAGTHENTVRKYVEWGFLAEPERAPNGYRLWTEEHREQMLFTRLALKGLWPGRKIRESVLALVRRAAGGDIAGALEDAKSHAAIVEGEIAQAREAAAFLERWARGEAAIAGGGAFLTPKEAASEVGATGGQIRNWERNRLVHTPRDPATGRRFYGSEEIGRLKVVRALLLAGYSVAAVLRTATELDRGRTDGLAETLNTLNTLNAGEEAFTAFDCLLTALAEQKERALLIEENLALRVAERRHQEAGER